MKAMNEMRTLGGGAQPEAPDASALVVESLEWVSDGIAIFDPENRLLYCNTAHKRFYDEISHLFSVGTPRETLIRSAVESGLIKSADGQEEEYINTLLGSNECGNYSRTIELADGRRLFCRQHEAGEGRQIIISTDITALAVAQEEAERAQQRLEGAIGSINEGFVLFDAEDRLVMWNSRFEKYYPAIAGKLHPGISFEEIIRINVDAGLYRDALGREEEFISSRLDSRKLGKEFIQRQLSSGLWVLVSDQRLENGDTVGIRTDISELMQREEALQKAYDDQELHVLERTQQLRDENEERRRTERDLLSAREFAERANQAKSDFLSRMSHELRTPLNAILGFGQLLGNNPAEPASEKQREHVGHILSAGKLLLNLIDDVLDLSRIESGSISVDPEEIPLRGLLKECRLLLEPLAVERGIQLKLDKSCLMDISVVADHTRLKEVFLNLLSNAVKYNRDNGRVTITCEPKGNRVRVGITDTGFGIPKDKMQTIFEPFNRLEADKSDIQGTGIGLTITRKLIDVMGLSLEVDSHVGEGSTFWVELPVSNVEVEDRNENVSESIDGLNMPDLGSDLYGTILYIEDNEANRFLMEEVIGCVSQLRLVTAETAEDGLAMLATVKPDLILMDLHLPGMSGMEALKCLKSLDDARDIPVLAISAAAMPREIEIALHAGFESYLTKPVNVAETLRTIFKVLSPLKS